MNIGDKVCIIALPPDLTEGEMATKSTFEKCLGHQFIIAGFDNYGALELDISAVTGSEFETIWIEPECVRLVA